VKDDAFIKITSELVPRAKDSNATELDANQIRALDNLAFVFAKAEVGEGDPVLMADKVLKVGKAIAGKPDQSRFLNELAEANYAAQPVTFAEFLAKLA
jgi:hypothetical protein